MAGLIPLREYLRTKLKAAVVREVTVPPNGWSLCPRCSKWTKQPMADPVTGVVKSCTMCMLDGPTTEASDGVQHG
jgi:hypothetical protein